MSWWQNKGLLMRDARLALCLGLVSLLGAAGPCCSAEPPAVVQAAADGIVIIRPGGARVTFSADALAQLPPVKLALSYMTEHGERQGSFEGPLLWNVLTAASAIDPAKPRGQVRQSLLITGHDGYSAVIALGEISPEFEGKQVILAERLDGEPLGPAHLRIVVPGDRRGGRGVHDVVSIALIAPDPSAQ